MIDTHCHIHSEEFDEDRDEVLRHAAQQGVTSVLAMGEGLRDNQRVLRTVAAQGRAGDGLPIRPCLGLHPTQALTEPLEPIVEQIHLHAGELAAIGEVGLDYWVAKEDAQREMQRNVLTRLAALAAELDLPLSVHSRSAGHHTIALLADCDARRVCMHAFDGSAKHAIRAFETHRFLFSIPPSVVRSPQKQKLVRRLPLEALLLETDAPVLGADREARNEPANVVVSARAIAEIKGCRLAEVQAQTTDNAQRLFRCLTRPSRNPMG